MVPEILSGSGGCGVKVRAYIKIQDSTCLRRDADFKMSESCHAPLPTTGLLPVQHKIFALDIINRIF